MRKIHAAFFHLICQTTRSTATMKTDIDTALDLLHTAISGTLATQSSHLPGYPFATALPFVADERHRPVFLVSMLAEHTRNLLADRRASFMVSASDQANILAGARMTLVGDAERIEASPALSARYLRYQPEAEQYLALGDFAFFRLSVKTVRYIAGFAHMGWIEESDWSDGAVLAPDEETELIRELADGAPRGIRLLGIDCHGIDIERGDQRDRQRFSRALAATDKIGEGVKRLLAALR